MPGEKRPHLFTVEEAVKPCERNSIQVDESMKLILTVSDAEVSC